MILIIGLIIVFGSVIGGYLMVNGPLGVLIQPSEIVVIGGACVGMIFISSPVKHIMMMVHSIPLAIKGSPYTKEVYRELLLMLYEFFVNVKKGSWLSIEPDISSPEMSSIFAKYPKFLANHHARDFFCDAMTMLINGTAQVEELETAMDAEIETHHEEAAIVPAMFMRLADSLPGLGIVAAVLGIIITMQHIDGPPEEIGHHVAAALVGTLLGLLFSYGLCSPLAGSLEKIAHAEGKYFNCIKAGVIAFAGGAAPAISVEFARKTIFTYERVSGSELEKMVREIKPR